MSAEESGPSDTSDTSVRSCIIVDVLPEDLEVSCTADCTPERCDNSTVRPNEPPAESGPPGTFIPFNVPARPPFIHELPGTPIDLLLQFIPRSLVQKWAQWTNEAPLLKEGPYAKNSRVHSWKNTSVDEIYLFLGILIYMGIHCESKISRYWSTQQQNEDPIHLFTRFIPRNRFQITSGTHLWAPPTCGHPKNASTP
ncbi:hypothetical protein CC80DRAFT_582566 [Byssothecium circinans]|uniref:PiggyBac transposable element-derived protein domain-containing protein n=1 Tax=Byssothecium circinans TaxID=147558 RepID=A0A6A5U5Q1_9PLEO|nr:hypothetical protein CC80DRAFT_582566 [Byssothecium circinans]